MEGQRLGSWNLHYPYGALNHPKSAERRLKMLHFIGCYNAAVFTFWIVKDHILYAGEIFPLVLVCVVSFCLALTGFAAEIFLSSKKPAALGSTDRPRSAQRGRSGQSMRELFLYANPPMHLPRIFFYFMLMLLWLFILLAVQ